ncbi:hypothetical protein [Halosegnis sp.]|uniref:DUF7504 family protein n=1 Tax=Halosegnis sp. TaxID=2864959 RepID=UPI0035D4C838
MSDAPDGYAFTDGLPLPVVPAGTNLLVAGRAMSVARDLALSLTVADPSGDDGAILVSTNTAPDKLFRQCGDIAPGLAADRLAIVDCNGQTGEEAAAADVRVVSVRQPNDLTGIGIHFSQLYERFHDAGVQQVRTGVVGVSTLLLYTDLRPVFRFLHVMTARVEQAEGLGVFLIDPGAHDEQAMSTLTQLFDGRIDVEETDDGTPRLRTRGLADGPETWTEFDV